MEVALDVVAFEAHSVDDGSRAFLKLLRAIKEVNVETDDYQEHHWAAMQELVWLTVQDNVINADDGRRNGFLRKLTETARAMTQGQEIVW